MNFPFQPMLSFNGLCCCNQLSSRPRQFKKLQRLADIKLFIQTILDSIIIIADMCFNFWNCLWCPKCSSKKTFHRMPKLICFNSLKEIIRLQFWKAFSRRIYENSISEYSHNLWELNQNRFFWSRTVLFPGKPLKVLIKVYFNWLWSILKKKINTRCHFLRIKAI